MSTTDHPRRAGFTLIEIMAVLVIISILSVFVLRTLMGGEKMVKGKATSGYLDQLSAIISEYEIEFGRYPPSTFPTDMDPKPSTVNMGSEMLVIALYRKDREWQAVEIDEDRLGNSDGDTTRRSLTSFSSAQAFEFSDYWLSRCYPRSPQPRPLRHFGPNWRSVPPRTASFDTGLHSAGMVREELSQASFMSVTEPEVEVFLRAHAVEKIDGGLHVRGVLRSESEQVGCEGGSPFAGLANRPYDRNHVDRSFTADLAEVLTD